MSFGEKLRALRKKTGMSQEKLAEKLNVSRQAVTKWETESGIPDIENIIAVSALFGVSIDELLSNERKRTSGYLFESVTEYDIDEAKRYDMKLGGARSDSYFPDTKEKRSVSGSRPTPCPRSRVISRSRSMISKTGSMLM